MKISIKRSRRPVIPVQVGKYAPGWSFHRKHGEQNYDVMVRKSSDFHPKSDVWIMCNRKARVTDEPRGLQFCDRHMQQHPPNTCTHDQATEILAELGGLREKTDLLLRAARKRPFLALLDKHQKQVEKDIRKEWGGVLDWLSKAVANGLECWVTTLPYFRENRSEPGVTLHILHGQACNLARAVTGHCKRGEIQSAISLWRSLFEIEVNMAFIAEGTTQRPTRAERFHDWNMARYFYINNLPSDPRMVELRRKYSGWKLKQYNGWTAPPDNPTATLDVPDRALQVGHVEKNRHEDGYSRLDIYNLCHSYVHNDMFGMLNSPLTSTDTPMDDPSNSGLDTPLCLTALSLTTVTAILLENINAPNLETELSEFLSFAEIQMGQVNLEVGIIRPELLSPLGGIDMSFVVESDEGTEYIVRPSRRGGNGESSKGSSADFEAEL